MTGESESIVNKRFLAILLLALSLRLAGISFGLPHLYHADEPIIVNHALAYGSGDFNPHFFNLPPLTSYILFFFYGIYFISGLTLGAFRNTIEFQNLFFSDPTSFYLIARVALGAILGTITVGVFYRMVRRHFGNTLAEISAFVFSIYFLHVRDSHYIYADIPLVFLIVVTFFSLFNLLEKPSFRSGVVVSIWIGIATAFKYNGCFLFAPFCCALWYVRRNIPFKLVILYPFIAFVFFMLLNPYALLDFTFFLRELSEQGSAQNGVGWTHHFRYSLVGSAGLPMTVAVLLGALGTFFKHDIKRKTLLFFGLIYYFVLVLKGQPYDRYVLPLVPFCVFFASDFILTAAQMSNKMRTGLLLLLLTGVCLPSIMRCVLWINVMKAPDVRTEASSWIESNIPSGERIALDWEFMMPRLLMSSHQLEEKYRATSLQQQFSHIQKHRLEQMINRQASATPQYDLYALSNTPALEGASFLLSKPRAPYDLATLKGMNINYVIINPVSKSNILQISNFYNDVKAKGKLIKEFSPYKSSSVQGPLDAQPLTGGPFLLSDLRARKSNGEPLQLYKIQ